MAVIRATTPLFLYNTLTRQKEAFKALTAGQVGLYSCGPTVYNYVHIGNLRSFVFSDLLRRTLEANGYEVKQVMNITDVDDKTIKASRAAGESLRDFTRRYEQFFLEDLAALNVKIPSVLARASEHIDDMATLVEKLLAKGLAYRADDGIYFTIGKFPAYGQLSKIKLGAETKERIKNDEYDKENAHDFALWKFHTPDDGEAFWQTSLGKGRPGWHIECSAMSMKYLGSHFDLHTGGIDLTFPHHENELSQSTGATGEPFVNYWLHHGFVNLGSDKMSKSLGNTLRRDDLEQEGITPLAYRYWLLTAHYRSTVNFTLEAGRAAQVAYRKLVEQFLNLSEMLKTELSTLSAPDPTYRAEFLTAINDDLNTPEAIALIWKLLKDEGLEPATKRATLLEFDEVLGLGLAEAKIAEIPTDVLELVQKREEARQNQDWTKADQLRAAIEAAGFTVEDSDLGPKIKLKP